MDPKDLKKIDLARNKFYIGGNVAQKAKMSAFKFRGRRSLALGTLRTTFAATAECARPPATRNAVSDLAVIGFLVESVICRRIKIKSDGVNTRGRVTRGGGSRFTLECAA